MAEHRRDANIGIVLDVEAMPRPWPVERPDETPFRILVIGDLSGSRTRAEPLSSRRPMRIDRDNFDDVLARVQPAAKLGKSGRNVVTIHELDDFHPDQLWSRLMLFEPLRSLRGRLDDPRVFEAAVREWLGESAPRNPEPDRPGSGGNLLEQMLEQSAGPPPAHQRPARRPPTPPHADELQEHIRRLVEPHLQPGEDPRRQALTAKLDAVTAEMMRAVLHDPVFRSLESVWRSLHMLVRRIESDEDIAIWVLDATRDELAAELTAGPAERSALHRIIVDEASGSAAATPWSLIVADLTFGPDPADLSLLEAMASIARRGGAPLLAGASPRLAGCPGFAGETDPQDWAAEDAAWKTFRQGPLARFVGLALPRFLLRLPWGTSGEPCDSLNFEEMEGVPEHEHYLWGNAAFACALLLAESFSQASWGMRPGMHQDLDGLPLYIYRVDGESHAKPCAETLMTERMAVRLLEAGLMPLASIRDRDVVRLVRFQSAAWPPAGLAGRWNTREA